MSRVIDTSVLYAAFDEDDPRHGEARADLGKVEPLRVPLPVLAEFLDLVAYRRGHAEAVGVWEGLRTLPTLEVVDGQDAARLRAIWQGHRGLSVSDAAGIQEALHSRAPLLTYDARQEKAYRALAR